MLCGWLREEICIIKKLFFSVILCLLAVLSISILDVHAYSIKENDVSTVKKDLSGERNYLGTLSKVSTVNIKDKYVSYESYWAPWQGQLYIELDQYIFDLYEQSKYVDIMVSEIERFRLEAHEEKSVSFKTTITHSVSQSQAISKSTSIFASYEQNSSLSVGGILNGLLLSSDVSSDFKVTTDYSKTISISNNNKYEKSIEASTVEIYRNDRNVYAYVARGFRQKYKVAVGVKTLIEYNKKRTGSGMWGRDSNYSYSFKDYKCESIEIYLIPVGNAYYDVSYYIDDEYGNTKFADQTNPSIVFI